jgi:hypothetical protein
VQSQKNWQASVGMTSAFVVPQLGQVMVDTRITSIISRIHEAKDHQDTADKQGARQKDGDSRATASNTGCARGDTATRDKHPAAADEKHDSGDQQRDAVRDGDPRHGDEPCAAETNGTE